MNCREFGLIAGSQRASERLRLYIASMNGMAERGANHGVSAHACHLFGSAQRRADVLTLFMAAGLREGSQVRVVAYTRAPDRAVGALAAEGFVLAHEMERGALDIVPARGTPLLATPFDAGDALEYVEERVSEALARSFTGLRLAMSARWALASAVRPEALLAFESGLNELAATLPLRVLCAYDAREFKPELLQRVRVFHDQIFDDGSAARGS